MARSGDVFGTSIAEYCWHARPEVPRAASLADTMFVVEGTPEPVSSARDCYEIRVAGVLDEHWSDWFDGFRLQREEAENTTVLVGLVADQATIHGVLSRILDLGLPLLSVRMIEAD
jgi:hypothetical protein